MELSKFDKTKLYLKNTIINKIYLELIGMNK